MSCNFTAMLNKIIYILMIILLAEIAFAYFMGNWEFKIPMLNVLNRIAVLFCALLLVTLVVAKISRKAGLIAGASFMFLFSLFAIAESNPMDTTTQPKDIAVLHKGENRHKIVVREYKNMKTNNVVRDTLLVKDVFLFRKKIKQM
jgi:hypothetical protein